MRALSLAVFLAVAVLTLAANQKDYPASEAANHVGESLTLSGKITSVHQISTGAISLDIDGHGPKPPFTVFIPLQFASAFSGAQEGRTVRVTGKIVQFVDTPEVVITDPSQIKGAQ